MPATPEILPDTENRLDLLMPLFYFYEKEGGELPPTEFIQGKTMPEPQRFLLVHDSDMTPRLRDYYQSPIGLKVVNVEKSDLFVMRQVVLERQDRGLPVEYGAIGIQLEGFPGRVRELIRSGAAPLGAILESERVPHTSAPRGFFRLAADEVMARLLNTTPGTVLYGRCNVLSHPGGIVFADIVEVLPPSPAE